MKTWILTGSPENFEATRERGFRVIGMKEIRRRMAEQIEPVLRLPQAPGSLPVALALRCPAAVLRDHATGECVAIAESDSAALLDRIVADALPSDAGPLPPWRGPIELQEDAPDLIAEVTGNELPGEIIKISKERRVRRTEIVVELRWVTDGERRVAIHPLRHVASSTLNVVFG